MNAQDAAMRRAISRRASVIAWLLAAAYVAPPAMRAVLVLIDSRTIPEFPSAVDVPALEPQGIIGAVAFLALATGFLALVCTTAGSNQDDARNGWMRFGTAAGVIGAAGLALVAVQGRVQFSWMSANLALVADDAGAQTAALWALNLASTAGLALFAVGAAAWATCLALDGRMVSRGWGVAMAVVACLFALIAAGLVVPAGQYLCVPLFACAAIAFRRASRDGAPSASPAADLATPVEPSHLGESSAP